MRFPPFQKNHGLKVCSASDAGDDEKSSFFHGALQARSCIIIPACATGCQHFPVVYNLIWEMWICKVGLLKKEDEKMAVSAEKNKPKTPMTTGNKEFDNTLAGLMPELKRLIRHKLRQWEVRGLIPKNEYSADDVADEVYLKIFDEYREGFSETDKLKVKLYRIANEVLSALKEKHVSKRISVEELLAKEAKTLEEAYTADAEGELLLMDELEDLDISYQPNVVREKVVLLDDSQIGDLVETFALEEAEALSEKDRKVIGKVYSDLPELAQSVIDHYAFVKFSVTEIAGIHNIPEKDVERIIGQVRARLTNVRH